jgi:hypothetical protein
MCGLKHQKEKRSMAYFAGLDVSVKQTSVCIVDDAGKIVREARVASEPEALLQVLTNTAGDLRAVCRARAYGEGAMGPRRLDRDQLRLVRVVKRHF